LKRQNLRTVLSTPNIQCFLSRFLCGDEGIWKEIVPKQSDPEFAKNLPKGLTKPYSEEYLDLFRKEWNENWWQTKIKRTD